MHIEWVVEYVLNAYLTRSKECMPVIESLASTVDPNHSVLANMVTTLQYTAHYSHCYLLSHVYCLLYSSRTTLEPNRTRH